MIILSLGVGQAIEVTGRRVCAENSALATVGAVTRVAVPGLVTVNWLPTNLQGRDARADHVGAVDFAGDGGHPCRAAPVEFVKPEVFTVDDPVTAARQGRPVLWRIG